MYPECEDCEFSGVDVLFGFPMCNLKYTDKPPEYCPKLAYSECRDCDFNSYPTLPRQCAISFYKGETPPDFCPMLKKIHGDERDEITEIPF